MSQGQRQQMFMTHMIRKYKGIDRNILRFVLRKIPRKTQSTKLSSFVSLFVDRNKKDEEEKERAVLGLYNRLVRVIDYVQQNGGHIDFDSFFTILDSLGDWTRQQQNTLMERVLDMYLRTLSSSASGQHGKKSPRRSSHVTHPNPPIYEIVPFSDMIWKKGDPPQKMLNSTGFNTLLRMSGDGNCFYRSLLVGLVFAIRADNVRLDVSTETRERAIMDLIPQDHGDMRKSLKGMFNPDTPVEIVCELWNHNFMSRDSFDHVIIQNFRQKVYDYFLQKRRQARHNIYKQSVTQQMLSSILEMGQYVDSIVQFDAFQHILKTNIFIYSTALISKDSPYGRQVQIRKPTMTQMDFFQYIQRYNDQTPVRLVHVNRNHYNVLVNIPTPTTSPDVMMIHDKDI